MFFSEKSRFRGRCRKRLKALGCSFGPNDDLTVDLVGGFRGRPHVFLLRTVRQPLAPSQIRDLQETKMRYWDRRFVCITEAQVTKNWIREAGERRVFLIPFDELDLLGELPPADDDALKSYLERIGS